MSSNKIKIIRTEAKGIKLMQFVKAFKVSQVYPGNFYQTKLFAEVLIDTQRSDNENLTLVTQNL